MSSWPSTRARRVLAALLRIGWVVKRQSGSHRTLSRTAGWADFVFAFHDDEEIGPRMLRDIRKRGNCDRLPLNQLADAGRGLRWASATRRR